MEGANKEGNEGKYVRVEEEEEEEEEWRRVMTGSWEQFSKCHKHTYTHA